MVIETLVVGLWQTNCYLVGDEETGKGAIIDPGGDAEVILAATRDWHIEYVIDTHAHFDHILGNHAVLTGLRERQDKPPLLVAHPQAIPLLLAGGGARWFGLIPPPAARPDLSVEDGAELSVGQLAFKVLHTPGHSPGSITLYVAAEDVAFVGDVLFHEGVGRADLPGGSWSTLLKSVRQVLFALPDETRLYPGHGPPTTVGHEKRNNPFVGRVA